MQALPGTPDLPAFRAFPRVDEDFPGQETLDPDRETHSPELVKATLGTPVQRLLSSSCHHFSISSYPASTPTETRTPFPWLRTTYLTHRRWGLAYYARHKGFEPLTSPVETDRSVP